MEHDFSYEILFLDAIKEDNVTSIGAKLSNF